MELYAYSGKEITPNPYQSINHLPFELLGNIFILAAGQPEDVASRPRSSFWLAHVDAYWRKVALATSHLWTTIPVTNPPSPGLMSFLFKHSKLRSLCIRFEPQFKPVPRRTIASFGPYIDRITNVHFGKGSLAKIVEKTIENLAMPNLKVLEWFPEEVQYSGADYFPPLNYPKLAVLRTDKDVVFCESTQSLRLRELEVGLGVYDSSHELQILEMYRDLRVCKLYISEQTPCDEVYEAVTAPRLTHLSILLGDKGSWETLLTLVCSVDAPCLKKLTIQFSKNRQRLIPWEWETDKSRTFSIERVKKVVVDLTNLNTQSKDRRVHPYDEACWVLGRFSEVRYLELIGVQLRFLLPEFEMWMLESVETLVLRDDKIGHGEDLAGDVVCILATMPKVRTLVMTDPGDRWTRHDIQRTTKRHDCRVIWETEFNSDEFDTDSSDTDSSDTDQSRTEDEVW